MLSAVFPYDDFIGRVNQLLPVRDTYFSVLLCHVSEHLGIVNPVLSVQREKCRFTELHGLFLPIRLGAYPDDRGVGIILLIDGITAYAQRMVDPHASLHAVPVRQNGRELAEIFGPAAFILKPEIPDGNLCPIGELCRIPDAQKQILSLGKGKNKPCREHQKKHGAVGQRRAEEPGPVLQQASVLLPFKAVPFEPRFRIRHRQDIRAAFRLLYQGQLQSLQAKDALKGAETQVEAQHGKEQDKVPA